MMLLKYTESIFLIGTVLGGERDGVNYAQPG
jgi:hypothetical protein